MRSLRLVFGRNGTMTTLVLAAVMPLGTACGNVSNPSNPGITGAGGLGGSGAAGTGVGGNHTGGIAGASAGGTAGSATGGTALGGTSGYEWSTNTSTASVPADYPYSGTRVPSDQCSYGPTTEVIVPLPPEGTPPTPTALCSATSSTPHDSGWAARITLLANNSDTSQAQGTITIAPELASSVVGLPVVRVVDLDANLTVSTLSDVVASSGATGYTFNLAFSGPIYGGAYGTPPRIVLETRFVIDCAGTMRELRALTALYLCNDTYATYGWASSGDRCIECASICEMIASPILPARENESTALASAVRLGLRVIGRLHGALVILAEHDGGANQFDYQWTATSGKLVWVDRDVALWVPPEFSVGHELVQVAMSSQRAAAVASLRWDALA